MNERGFAVLRDVHDPALITCLQSEVIEELDSVGAIEPWSGQGQPVFRAGTDDRVPRVAHLPQTRRSERLNSLANNASLLQELATLYGSEVFVHPNRLTRAVPPDREEWAVAPSVHADCFELQGSLRQVTMWSPLFPVTENTGTLPVFSSKNGNLAPSGLTLSSDNQSGWTLDPEHLGRRHVFDLQPGDALLFYATTAHGGSVNDGTGWRVSVEMRFQPLADPICRDALKPYDGSTWEEVQNHWRIKDVSWKHQPLETIDFDPLWEDWRAIESINRGSRGDETAIQGLANALLHRNLSIRAEAARILEMHGWR